MDTGRKIDIAVSIAKLVVSARGLLEALDDLQGTNVYSGKLRGLANRIETEASKHNKINTDNEYANAIIQDISMQVDRLFDNYRNLLLTNVKELGQEEGVN